MPVTQEHERRSIRLTEVPAQTGVSIRQVRRAARTGELPVVQISERVRVVMLEDLERWLRSRRSAGGRAGA